MNESESKYLKFIDYALELCKNIPKHFSKFSNKIFCNHQKIILLVLKQKLKTTYRDLIELLKITNIPLYIGLKRIPHHTTLVKFEKKVKLSMLNYFLPYREAKNVGVDGTGFEVGNKSLHYQLRTARSTYKQYIKLGISADLDKQIILKQTINKGPRNDQKDFFPLMKGIKAKCVCADKGYDATKHHVFIIRDLNAESLICVKNHFSKNNRNTLRKRVAKNFDEQKYHQRSKVETIFSVIKRKYGSSLKAKTLLSQKREVFFKLIAYNVDKAITLFSLFFQRVSAEPK